MANVILIYKEGDLIGKCWYIKEDGKKNGCRQAIFRCECNKLFSARLYQVRIGQAVSCGCGINKVTATTHGLRHTSEYMSWHHMKDRCKREKNPCYKHYGGRGIKVCEKWLESFENFISDMGMKPNKKYTIDRIDVNGNYTPENCRWATALTQGNNKRNNRFLEYRGKLLSVAQWSREISISQAAILKRIKLGWHISMVLSPDKFNGRY